MTTGRVLVLALLAATLSLPGAAADHTETSELRCDGGWCSDGEHRVLDCSGEACRGDARAFPTIVNPSYDDGEELDPDDRVLVTTVGERPLAYPIEVMNYFETIEEHLDGEPVIVTYCPLCGSGIVFSREVGNRTLTLYNSGEIWKNDLVMYDVRTGSRWTQVGGEAIQGQLHGETLELLPSRLVLWGDWHEAHPDTLALERPTDEEGNPLAPYDRDPYRSYRFSESAPQGHEASGTGLHPKARVVGVAEGDEAIAFPLERIRKLGVHQAELGERSIVAGYAGEAVHVYDADGHTFEPGPENGTMTDANGTTWSIATGRSETGDALEPVPSESLFWFAWLSFNPDTRVVNATGQAEPVPEGEPPRSVPASGALAALAAIGAGAFALRRLR